ncbi:MAG: restriction endonuclease [Candidatus Aminicenantes bacterium]|nr:restriction endonuclease [Candidatus Aminicenantes bacterium]MBL7083652.1 restriction endonuclease [Candidatus Aminicenantes bacterium]
MALLNFNFYSRTKLKIASKIFPVRKTKISLLDNLNLELQKTKINQINIPSISPPEITNDFCPEHKSTIEIDSSLSYIVASTCENTKCAYKFLTRINGNFIGERIKITCPQCNQFFIFDVSKDCITYDFSAWIKEQLQIPEIESIELLSKKPRRAGKLFSKAEAIVKEEELFTSEEGSKECIHGLKKNWCSICSEKERQEKEIERLKVDPFDLIFPILQPPLGDNFDSSIAFPKPLYDFQRTGIKFLIERDRALLGDEMGLGKTIQAICATRFLFRTGNINNCLILCPRSVLSTWEKELWDWAPELRLIKIRGTREQREISWNSPAHIYLTTYETLRQDLQSTLGNYKSQSSKTLSLYEELEEQDKENIILEDIAMNEFDLIILDEIQKIKNPKAEVTKAARNIETPLRWGLSGTPLENRLEELISIFAYLKPGLLIYKDASRPWKVKKAIEPYFLRRRKADALPDLPDKVHEEKWLELFPFQREAYDLAEMEGKITLNEKGESITVHHIFSLITKLKQICNIEPVSKESCKLEYLTEVLGDITEQGDKVLIFSQYPEKTLRLIEPALKKYNPIIYHGALSDKQRDQKIKKFQDEEDNKILLMSIKAGGLGITLHRACYVFHFDFWWNPSVADQAESRAHRIGQEKTVFVTSLFTKDSIEERIQQLLQRKRELFREVIDDLSDTNLSKAITEEELFGLFGLNKPERHKQKIKAKDRLEADGSLEQISPHEFEGLIGKLYEKMGYYIKLTPQTKDKGVDIYTQRSSESGTEYLAIQCKHYPKGVVGVEHARALYGVIQSQMNITKGILITSGRFSKDCREFAENKRIELFDGTYLRGLLEKYDVFFE